MTKEQVRAKYGTPKKVSDDSDGSWWYYDHGPFLQGSAYVVYFDKDGRVDSISNQD